MKFATPHSSPDTGAATTESAGQDAGPFISYPGGVLHTVHAVGPGLRVTDTRTGRSSAWTLAARGDDLAMSHENRPEADGTAHALAALDAAFSLHPARREIVLAEAPWLAPLAAAGVLLPHPEGTLRACKDTLWQHAALWLPQVPPPMAQRFALTNGRYHPRRAPKQRGVLYQRYIPWLDRTFSFRSLDTEQDLPRFHRWMNDPDVAVIWEEEGDLDKHRAYLQGIDRDPHMQSMMASLDGEPFAYFESYWTKESRIAPFYDAHDYDRGWHVLVGEPAFRGKAFATAWLTSISHYLFLCDPRTQRVLGEPRIDHHQQIRNLDKSGYAKVKEFDLPHKRAQLVMLLREHYFYDGLWLPRS
ncbi:acetyltransferase [Acidovorax sp. GBBC 3334]|uniref:GNAT family N-acetyltransferase n=1 Tax=Acidovorax sp. GBBC 3334 TaxID=2940496 RepID=UPI002302D0AA|nr:GNAT family N-acetyltransferase [Acidovorax sp. GBBC 3334]MDA8456542.1 acetyltransferase [Acidovorax sp. GBBC 3334]